MAWNVDWGVTVAGVDVTDRLRPFLLSIEVEDRDGQTSDACRLTIDDSNGQAILPKPGSGILVRLEGVPVFSGMTDTPRSQGSRGGGQTLSVSAKGFDAQGKVKEPQSFHMDDTNLEGFMGKAATQAGLSGIDLDPAFAAMMRDYWSADGESFLHLGQRLARELGGTFKIRGDRAVLARQGEGIAPNGLLLPTVTGRVGENVIGWNIAPFMGRRRFARARVNFFDRETASYQNRVVEYELEDQLADVTNVIRSTAKDADQAAAIGDARKREAMREGGEGSVELDITPEAQAEGTFLLEGAREGVDGTYRIASVRHRASRSSGSTTSLEIKQPAGGAGRDERKPTEPREPTPPALP